MGLNKNRKLFVIHSIGKMEEGVLLNKFYEILKREKINFIFCGWNRKKNAISTDYKTLHLLKGGGYTNYKLILFYPIWILKVFLFSLKIKKNDIILIFSFDVAIPVYINSLLKGYSYIFYNQDNFSLTYNLKGIIKIIVESLEKRIGNNSLFHILPIKSRLNYEYKNMLIIPNFPLESELIKAKKILINKRIDQVDLNKISIDKRLKIYINGRIVYHRGAEWIANFIELLDPEKFLFVVAGEINYKKLSDKINNLENVIKFKRLENYKALSLYYLVDIVLTFYDPILPINRKAAPNKWWDCVACNVPFIANDEIETLKEFKQKNACFTVPYGDVNAIIKLLNDLEKNREIIDKVKSNLSKFKFNSWDKNITFLLDKLKI